MANKSSFSPLAGALRVGSIRSSAGTFALNTAYTYGTAGHRAVCISIIALRSEAITSVYVYCTAIWGTGGTVNVELRNAASLTAPGSTLHASQSGVAVPGANKWIKCTFSSPYTVTAGTCYFLVIGNSDADPTNQYPTIATGGGPYTDGVFLRSRTSTDGAITTSLVGTGVPCVIRYTTGAEGQPYTATATGYTSNTRERGFKITPPVGMAVGEIEYPSSTSITGMKIYADGTAPGGATLGSITWSQATALANPTPLTELTAGSTYRLVFTYSAAATSPTYMVIGDYASHADVQACVVGYGWLSGTIDNGAGGWTDTLDVMPNVQLALLHIAEPVSGGSVIIIED